MIRHVPFGSGHPYSIDTEQRDPIDPISGSDLTLGVRATPDIVRVELVIETTTGERTESATYSLRRVDRSSRGRNVDGGHLASAQARLARQAAGWATTVQPGPAGSRLRYRFSGTTDCGVTQRTRWFETSVFGWQDAGDEFVAAVGQNRVMPGRTRILTDGTVIRRVRWVLPLGAAERVTGFGERYDAIDHRGTSLDSVVFEQYKSQGAERKTYFPMPFAHVVGGEGWGFHVQTSRRVWFDIGQSQRDELVIEAETDAAGPAAVSIAFYDGAPAQVLSAFLDEVGKPEELPEWVFGLWASGNEWNTQARVMRELDAHREHDIPVGSVVIEAWSDESTFTAFRDARYTPTQDGAPLALADFEFPAGGAWPDPKGMVDELHARNVRVHLWQIPLLKMRPHPSGQLAYDVAAAIDENVLIQEPNPRGGLRPYRNRGWWFPLALMPDLTDERSATWWTQKRRYLVDEIGIDGFKTDGGEHAWGRELVYQNGSRGDVSNNLFPRAYAKAYGDLLRSVGKAPVTFSRAGFTGSQAHGAFWAGDENSSWDAFRWSLLAGLNAASCGVLYWGWDIAGFSGAVPTAELYLRATAASVFVPIMQYHSEFNHHRTPSRDRTPWNIAEQSGDERVIPVFRHFAKLRERLIPYLADQARESIHSSVPLMRPLWFDHPEWEGSWRYELQWMLGRELFVSPVVAEGAHTHTVALPPGEWVDVWTGERLSGPVSFERAVPWAEVAVYCRAESWGSLADVFAG